MPLNLVTRGLAAPSTSRPAPVAGLPTGRRARRRSSTAMRSAPTPPPSTTPTPTPTSQAERFVAELVEASGSGGQLSTQLGALVAQVRAFCLSSSQPPTSDAARGHALTPSLSSLSPSPQARTLQAQIDAAYASAFAGLAVEVPDEASGSGGTRAVTPPPFTEATFGALGRDDPAAMAALLAAKASSDPAGWRAFQAAISDLKARRSRAEGEAGAVRAAIEGAAAEQRAAARRAALLGEGGEGGGVSATPATTPRTASARVVVVTGFEAFNARLYEQAAADAAAARPGLTVSVFSDADISGPRRGELEAALEGADAFFGSLLFDYDQVSEEESRAMEGEADGAQHSPRAGSDPPSPPPPFTHPLPSLSSPPLRSPG